MEKIRQKASAFFKWISSLFVKREKVSNKPELNFQRLKVFGVIGFVLFVIVVLFLPDEPAVDFEVKSDSAKVAHDASPNPTEPAKSENSGNDLWAAPQRPMPAPSGGANYNTSMVLSPHGGNAKTQLRPGFRVALRILDKFIVSDSPVPILAESILNVTTESGLVLPAGTKFYGEASHEKDMDRATVRFSQISLPSGEIRPVSAIALGKDGQPGVPGTIHSDALKNTAGEMITTFVGGFAAGSMQTDYFGTSRGGLQNGLLNAVSTTAKDRAQDYGEKLKNERQWIEVSRDAECDAAFSNALNLQTGGDVHD